MKFNFAPEEFVVEEIALNGAVLEVSKTFVQSDLGEACFEKASFEELEEMSAKHRGNWFSWFVLEKTLWDSSQALSAIARRLGVSRARFDFAGNKDRQAVTTQLCSAFAIEPKRLLGVNVKDLKINGAWLASKKVRLGDLKGNRFTLVLNNRNCGCEKSAKELLEKAQENNFCYTNFFGSQRFGSLRKNTAQVGELILKNDLEGAVRNYLCFVDEESEVEKANGAAQARVTLDSTWGDFASALEYFPSNLKFERLLLEKLAASPTDFAGALRALPRSTLLLFVHAFQSLIFNELLEKKIAQGVAPDESLQAAIIGYESVLTQEEQGLLEARGLSKDDFKIKSFPEISSKGSTRALFVKMNGFEILSQEPLVVRFDLPSGSYATVALDFLLK